MSREQIILEIQGDWIFVKQGNDYTTIENHRLTDESILPSPQDVKQKLKSYDIIGNSCIIILPRLYWALSIEGHQVMPRRELKATRELARDLVATNWLEPTFSTTFMKKIDMRNMIYAAAIPQALIQRYTTWLTACGLKVKEFRLSCSTMLLSEVDYPAVLISGYPNGTIEIHWSSKGCLTSTYTIENCVVTEFSKILALMTLKHLSKSSIELWTDLPSEIEINCQDLSLAIYVSGDFRCDLTTGINAWANMLIKLGINLEYHVDEVPGYECSSGKLNFTWPAISAQGVMPIGASGDCLKLQPKQTHKRSSTSGVVVGLILFSIVVGTLVGYARLLTANYNRLSSEWSQMQLPYQEVVTKRETNNELERTVQAISNKIATRSDFISGLTLLDKVLPKGSKLDSFMINKDGIDFVLRTPSVTKALLALQQQVVVNNVAFTTAITSEISDGLRLEKVGIHVELVPALEVKVE